MPHTIERRATSTERRAVKETPILMSAPMVRATLDGSKTQTRRAGKLQSDRYTELGCAPIGHQTKGFVLQATYRAFPNGGSARWAICECPYGALRGDRLWVKETHWRYGQWVKNGLSKKTGRQKWKFEAHNGQARFTPQEKTSDRTVCGWYKRPAIFLPRKLSRITLEIASIRVERVQEITEADAKAEGVGSDRPDMQGMGIYRFNFAHVWEWLNHERAPWDSNPWVWVIEFKRLPEGAR